MKKGKKIRLTNGRRLVSDIVEIANSMPLAPLIQEVDLSEHNALKKKIRPKINWTVIMMRAYGLTAKQFPEIRQSWAKFPTPHIYEHFENVCMNTVTREYNGETRLFFARIYRPENRSLHRLQTEFEDFRRKPVKEIKQFRSQILFAKLPQFMRRMIWWSVFNVFPHKRASHMGTFGMSLSAFRKTKGTYHLGPTTTTLGYELFPTNGQMRLTLTFDHRIIDGKPATEIMDKLVETLRTQILNELRDLAEGRISQSDEIDSIHEKSDAKNAA